MHPHYFGDTYEMAKMCMLDWLEPGRGWLIHPMYFPRKGETQVDCFPQQYAAFLGLRLVGGDISQRINLVKSVDGDNCNLFIDPDTGLRIGPRNPKLGAEKWKKFVTVKEYAEIAQAHKSRLVLVYDQSIRRAKDRRGPIAEKLNCLRQANLHAAAYVSHIAFIWASTDDGIVDTATRRCLRLSRLPACRFIVDGCGHIPRH